MRRLHWFVAALVVTGCGDRGSVTFNITAPESPLFNPVAQPELVTEYDIRTASGNVIGIASAVQGSGSNSRWPVYRSARSCRRGRPRTCT